MLLDEGIDRLRAFTPRCHGVDVDALIHDAMAARDRLVALGAAAMTSVDVTTIAPHIQFDHD